MRRLATRLLVSHAVVALVAAATTLLLSRLLAPGLYDRSMAIMGSMMGRVPGDRERLLSVVADAATIGAAVGLAVAVGVGAWWARRLMGPLEAMSAGVHRLAAGRYDVPVEAPPETELAALAEDVNALAAELARTEQRRLELLGDVAHEMRTPLAVLDGYVEGLQDGVFRPGPDTYAELGAELARLRRLSDDLSALSRAQEGVSVDLRDLDLGAVVGAAAERLRPQLQDAGLVLEVQVEPAHVRGDAVRLGQVVTNLVGNALAATPRGGRVVVTTGVELDEAVVRVGDTGVGLSAPDLTRVFERFYRVPGSPRSPGSGIGLTISAAIAAAHGGTLAAESHGPGLGATFTLRLPSPGPRRSGR